MALTIKWNKRAAANFKNIANYIECEFGNKTAMAFVQKSYRLINSLKEFPELGSLEVEAKKIRGLLITKHCRLFYRYTKTNLILISFFDTRQNPKKKKL